MPRQLIAFVDRAPTVPPAAPGQAPPSPSETWPALHVARTGNFDHVVLIASARFRWDEILAGPDDRLLPDAVAEPEAARAPESETKAPPAEPVVESEPAAPAPDESAAVAADSAPVAPTAEPAEPEKEDDAPTDPAQAPRRKPGSERRPPARTLGELRARLIHMAQGGRVDRAALDQLAKEIGRDWGHDGIVCRVNPPFARDREQVAFIRGILGLLEPGKPVVLEFADGPRSTAGLGLTLAHGITTMRQDVPIAELVTDRERNLALHPRSLLHAIEIQELWRGAATGAPSPALIDHMRSDPRLQGLAAPAQRLARGLEFGSPAESARAAKAVKERLDSEESGKRREDWFMAVRHALKAVSEPLLADRPWSQRQLWMAEVSERRGAHFLTALHLREALISGLLETYGHNAARGWAPAGGEAGVEARIRPREVMAVVLNDPESARLVPDLGQVWKWVGAPRTKFALTSPIALDPALLREGNQALETLVPLTRAILVDGRLKAIVEALPYEKAVELAIGQNAIRVAPPRGKRQHRRDPGPHEDAAAPRDEAPRESQDRPPRDRERRPDRERRGPRPDREPRRDRPREVTARGPRPGPHSDPSLPLTSVPVGGTIRVERSREGLGNLGFALRNAGLAPESRDRKDRSDHRGGPRRDKTEAKDAPPPAPPAEPPAAATPEQAPPPPPPAPEPDFDVAGPAS